HDLSGDGRPAHELARGAMYRGGCLQELERMLEVRSDHILYVGDHIYGDVLRAKKESAWRTLMIIQEMTDELDAIERYSGELERLNRLEEHRDSLQDGLRDRQGVLRSLMRKLAKDTLDANDRVELQAAKLRLRRSIERLRVQLSATEQEHGELERR